MFRTFTLAFTAMTLIAGCGTPVRTGGPTPALAKMPLGAFGQVRDWRPDGSGGIYVESDDRAWYHATFVSPCAALPYALHLDLRTAPPFPIENFDSVQIHDEVCYFKTLDPIPGPPDQPAAAQKPR
jgi:hypothetical protein